MSGPGDTGTTTAARSPPDGDDPAARVKVWRRWTDPPDVPFHEYCELWPRTRPPVFGLGAEHPEGAAPPLSYAPPLARWALRHTPVLVLSATILYTMFAFVRLTTPAVSNDLGVLVTPPTGLVLMALLLWGAVLLWLARAVLPLPGRGTGQGVVVYGLLAVFTAGMVVGTYASTPGLPFPFSTAVEETVRSFPFAFLWMLLLGGLLVYDGMLRTENMFATLDRKRPAIVDDRTAYRDFLEALQTDLDARFAVRSRLPAFLGRRRPFRWLPATVPTAALFAAVFVAPFFLVWWLVPIGLNPIANQAVRGLAAAVVATLDFFLVVVFFQFLVLITYFNYLLTDADPTETDRPAVTLTYKPDHHDDYAGFRDLGAFAMRVNVLLVIGGIYEAYHLYVRGFRKVPATADGLTLELLSWGVANVVPLLVYGLAVVVWLYLSFWQIHKAMRRGRERKLEEYASQAEDPGVELRDGPVWPVNDRLLVTIVSMDLVPFLSLFPFLRF